MYCHYCGAQIIDGAKFCAECGARLEGEELKEHTTDDDGISIDSETRPSTDEEPIRQSKRRSFNSIFIIAVCIFALLLGCVALISQFGEDDNYKESEFISSISEKSNFLDKSQDVLIDGLNYSIKSMMFARHNGNLKYMDMAEEGLVNCVVYVDVDNKTKHRISLKNYDAIIICNGMEYDQILWEDSEFLFYTDSISAEEKLIKKAIDFQIPKEQQYSDSEIIFAIISPSGEQIAWKLR